MTNNQIEIPNKSSFKINEVCALTGVKSYVLRFWESEFIEISPLMSSAGLKLYERKDIKAILLIKKLLFVDKLSIERARGEMQVLMLQVPFVEENFQIENGLERSAEDYKEDYEEDYEEESEKAPLQRTRFLKEIDIEKLILAKSKLSEILSLTERLHQKNNWF